MTGLVDKASALSAMRGEGSALSDCETGHIPSKSDVGNRFTVSGRALMTRNSA